MSSITSDKCYPVSCRYCCKIYQNQPYCPMESQCGGLGVNRATIVILSIVGGLLLIALVLLLIYRLCYRRIETQQFTTNSKVLAYPSSRIGQQFQGFPGSNIYNQGSARGMLGIPTGGIIYT